MELNPRHPVTKAARDQWHKLLAIVMHKYKIPHVMLTIEDIKAVDIGLNITVQERDNAIHLRLVDDKTAAKLAKEHGGQVYDTDN